MAPRGPGGWVLDVVGRLDGTRLRSAGSARNAVMCSQRAPGFSDHRVAIIEGLQRAGRGLAFASCRGTLCTQPLREPRAPVLPRRPHPSVMLFTRVRARGNAEPRPAAPALRVVRVVVVVLVTVDAGAAGPAGAVVVAVVAVRHPAGGAGRHDTRNTPASSAGRTNPLSDQLRPRCTRRRALRPRRRGAGRASGPGRARGPL